MRDRLIEILKKFCTDDCKITHQCGYCDFGDLTVCPSAVAEHLLANCVIVPPCKVGDTVWFVYTPKWPANPADKGKWFMIEDGVQRIIYGAKGLSIETWNVGTIPAKDIGTKLFFTQDEAERVLEDKKKLEK